MELTQRNRRPSPYQRRARHWESVHDNNDSDDLEQQMRRKGRRRSTATERVGSGRRLLNRVGASLLVLMVIATGELLVLSAVANASQGLDEVAPDTQLEAKQSIANDSAEVRIEVVKQEEVVANISDYEAADDDEQNAGIDRRRQFGARNNNSDENRIVLINEQRHYAPHFQSIIGAPSIQAHISRHSWERYRQFKEETCRKVAETDLAERRLNSTESAYFHWEENEFHQELRKKLLPQTQDGSFRSLVNSQLLGSLDPRLFVSKPKSLCKMKRLVDDARDERQKQIKEEKHMFEDFLINKVLDPSLFAVPTKTIRRSNGTTTTKREAAAVSEGTEGTLPPSRI